MEFTNRITKALLRGNPNFWKRRKYMRTRKTEYLRKGALIFIMVGVLLLMGLQNYAFAQIQDVVIDRGTNSYEGVRDMWRDSQGRIHIVLRKHYPPGAPAYYVHSYYTSSDDEGLTWATPKRITFFSDSSSPGDLDGDSRDVLHHSPSFNVGGFYHRSFDRGGTWEYLYNGTFSAPYVMLDGGWGAWDGGASLAIGPNDEVHAAFASEYGWNDPPYNIYYKRSLDGGNTWTSPVKITNEPNTAPQYSYDAYGYFVGRIEAGPENTLYLVYYYYADWRAYGYGQVQPGTQLRQLLRISNDGGVTWGPEINLATGLTGADWFGIGGFVVDTKGIMHYVYGLGGDVYHRTYDPSTGTFGTPANLSQAPGCNSDGIQISVNDRGDFFVVFSAVSSTNPDERQGYLSRSTDGGQTWSDPAPFGPSINLTTHALGFMTAWQYYHYHPKGEDILWYEYNRGTGIYTSHFMDLAGLPTRYSGTGLLCAGVEPPEPENQPPVAGCQDATVSADANCQGSAEVNNGSYDPDGDPITLAQAPPSPYGLGTTSVTLAVTDDKGASDSCSASVTVNDDTPPNITCPGNQTAECTGPNGASASFSATATDNCNGVITTGCSPASGSTFPLGDTTDTCTATDNAGNKSDCSFTVTVVDTTPPFISSVSASPNVLWPSNHKMVPVTISISVTDVCDPNVGSNCQIISVTSNEPVNGLGDGDAAPDWEITGNLTVNLRAERSGKGSGRVYTITVQCKDAAGKSSTKNVAVTVPRDKGK